MITPTLALSLLFSAPDATMPGDLTVPVAPAPHREDVQRFADTRSDGSRVWGAEATYELSSGDTGEAFFVIDSDGAGEAQLLINGDIVAHVSVALDPVTGQPITTTWYPPDVDYEPELIAEMMRVDLPLIVAGTIPQEFKCSPFGKKVTRAASLLFRATAYAASAVCCVAGIPAVGCVLCVVGAGLAGDEIGKVIDEHCE